VMRFVSSSDRNLFVQVYSGDYGGAV